MRGWSAFTKTIAKDAGIEKLELDEKKVMSEDQRDFVPAWPGADISEEKWKSMTKEEQEAYTEKYGD